MKDLLILLAEFIRFGLFTFGGGWSIIAQMQQLYVEKKRSSRRKNCWTSSVWPKAFPAL